MSYDVSRSYTTQRGRFIKQENVKKKLRAKDKKR
jgi:hypothetical protein